MWLLERHQVWHLEGSVIKLGLVWKLICGNFRGLIYIWNLNFFRTFFIPFFALFNATFWLWIVSGCMTNIWWELTLKSGFQFRHKLVYRTVINPSFGYTKHGLGTRVLKPSSQRCCIELVFNLHYPPPKFSKVNLKCKLVWRRRRIFWLDCW